VTEGGRARYYREFERFHTRSDRFAIRNKLRKIRTAADGEETDAGPTRAWQEFDSAFRDKLSAVKRYLASQAGRPWADVYSELCRRYDRRTLKGWHLIDEHIRLDVEFTARWAWWTYMDRPPKGPWIDSKGILRYRRY
jgi:hypothetical protein